MGVLGWLYTKCCGDAEDRREQIDQGAEENINDVDAPQVQVTPSPAFFLCQGIGRPYYILSASFLIPAVDIPMILLACGIDFINGDKIVENNSDSSSGSSSESTHVYYTGGNSAYVALWFLSSIASPCISYLAYRNSDLIKEKLGNGVGCIQQSCNGLWNSIAHRSSANHLPLLQPDQSAYGSNTV